MVLHLTTCPMMLLWSSTSMVTTQGVPKIWIYTYQDVQKNFVNAVSYIQAVCCGMTCPMSWKNPVHLLYLKATIVSSLVDNLGVYMGKFICRCTLFNPLHIPGFFLPTSRVLYKRYFVSYFRIIYQIFYGMTFMLCWYVICLFILCGIILCFRQGSKVEQIHWLVIPCINMFEKQNMSAQ